MATLKALYRWAGRQIEGFVESIFKLMHISLTVLDHSTLSRRMKALEIDIPVQPTDKARHGVIDSTGVKVYGEGDQRDENLRQIRRRGRKRWKQDSRYHRRSLAETGMFRFKTTFGDRLSSRNFDNQATEMFVKCAPLNKLIQHCKPDSYAVNA
jgi:hypothetical protein